MDYDPRAILLGGGRSGEQTSRVGGPGDLWVRANKLCSVVLAPLYTGTRSA